MREFTAAQTANSNLMANTIVPDDKQRCDRPTRSVVFK